MKLARNRKKTVGCSVSCMEVIVVGMSLTCERMTWYSTLHGKEMTSHLQEEKET